MINEEVMLKFLTTHINSKENISSIIMLDQLKDGFFNRAFELLVNKRIGLNDIKNIVNSSNTEEVISSIEKCAYILNEASYSKDAILERDNVLLSDFNVPAKGEILSANNFNAKDSLESKLDLNANSLDIIDYTNAVRVGKYNNVCYPNEDALSEAFYIYVLEPLFKKDKSITAAEITNASTGTVDEIITKRKALTIKFLNIPCGLSATEIEPAKHLSATEISNNYKISLKDTPATIINNLYRRYVLPRVLVNNGMIYDKPYKFTLRINDNLSTMENEAEFFGSLINFNLFGSSSIKTLDEICHEIVNLKTRDERNTAVVKYLYRNVGHIALSKEQAAVYGVIINDDYTLLCNRINFNNSVTRIYYAARWILYNTLVENNRLLASKSVVLSPNNSVSILYDDMKDILSVCEKFNKISGHIEKTFKKISTLNNSDLFTKSVL